jgi:glycosyltransferase involved in cell wall biosynthesis
MHVLFVHQNFPAQFGHVAEHLGAKHGWRSTFVSQSVLAPSRGVEHIQYRVQGGATHRTHYYSRSFENAIWHSHAVYEALRARPDIRPDLIVGHSGFCSTLFLRELYDAPMVNYFEYYYRTKGTDMDFRPDFPALEANRLRARARNATLLLDLDNCDAGYSPTQWQRDLLPRQYHEKVRVLFDGVDTTLWRPMKATARRVGDRTFPEGARIVSYASRGFESMRGFDIFMKMAKRLCDRRRDVIFLIAGEDRGHYGSDERVTGCKSFKQWVLAQDDLSRFEFLGMLPPPQLAELFNATDLHVYLTVPFVLSWSLLDALACGATVLASDTAPVREVVTHGQNGLLADFFDVDGLAATAGRVLDAPEQYRPLGAAGVELIRQRYSMDACMPRTTAMYEQSAQAAS